MNINKEYSETIIDNISIRIMSHITVEQNYNILVNDILVNDILVNDISNFLYKINNYTEMVEYSFPIITLIYIERFLNKGNKKLTKNNWKSILLISTIITLKMWDDDSMYNSEFAKLYENYPLKRINKLEIRFLKYINYNLNIKENEYKIFINSIK